MKLTAIATLILLVSNISCTKDKQPAAQRSSLSSNKDITGFAFTFTNNSTYLSYDVQGAIINDTIHVSLPAGTQVSNLVPTISITGVAVEQKSGVAQDFSTPVTYTVTAEDKTTKKYVVLVTVQIADAFDVLYTAGVDANTSQGHVYAINADNGTMLWSAKTTGSVTAPPIININNILVADSNALRALDVQTGKEIWRFETNGLIRSIPSLYQATVYFQNDDMKLYALERATGVLKWKFDEGQYHSGNAASPLPWGSSLYVACSNGRFLALDTTAKLLWEYQNAYGRGFTVRPAYFGSLYIGDDSTHLLHLDPYQGTLVSTYTMPGKFNTCSNNSYGIIYTGSIDGKVYAINGMAPYAAFDTHAPILNNISVFNDNVYVCSGSKLFSLKDGANSANWEYDNGDAIQASAVYFGNNNGQVYITSKGTVTAVDAHTGQLTWRFHTLSSAENMTSVCLADKRGNVSYPAESGNYKVNN